MRARDTAGQHRHPRPAAAITATNASIAYFRYPPRMVRLHLIAITISPLPLCQVAPLTCTTASALKSHSLSVLSLDALSTMESSPQWGDRLRTVWVESRSWGAGAAARKEGGVWGAYGSWCTCACASDCARSRACLCTCMYVCEMACVCCVRPAVSGYDPSTRSHLCQRFPSRPVLPHVPKTHAAIQVTWEGRG